MLKATNGKVVITAKNHKQLAIKVWRAHGFGRLYWKSRNRGWRWDSDVCARARSGVAGVDFLCVNAIWEMCDFELIKDDEQ